MSNAPPNLSQRPIDLSQLALDRSSKNEAMRTKPRPKRWMTRYVLPIGLVLGFVVLLGTAAGRRLLPTPSVTVVPVIVKRSATQQTATKLFQSPGWVEPRPTAMSVAALTTGVIEALLVVDGQELRKGEAIARLISIDAELIVEQSRNALAISEGELNRVRAELAAATIRFETPVHLHVQLADAESALARAQTEIAKLPFLIAAAEANEQFALNNMEGKRSAGAGISGRVVAQAESEHLKARAQLQELRTRKPNLEHELAALVSKVDAIRLQIEMRVEETRQVEEANAKLQSAVAMLDEAKLQLKQAELALSRNIIRAPADGRVLRLIAAPGTRVMGLEPAAGQSSSTVIEMYDPKRLQVRADVRLEDIPMVARGQTVEIETASSESVIVGRVLQVTSSASIQKNTLEVKVELIDPPPTVSPEMLVTATFLAPVIENQTTEGTEADRLFVPSQLVQSAGPDAFVWVVDDTESAQQRRVELGSPGSDGLVEIVSGLNVTDKLIASGIARVKNGRPVEVSGDDQVLGMH